MALPRGPREPREPRERRERRERRSPLPQSDFVVEDQPVGRKTKAGHGTAGRAGAPSSDGTGGADTKPLPDQWPAKKRQKCADTVEKVATIDNLTLMNELHRRGLFAYDVQHCQPGHWNQIEDQLLEDAVNKNIELFHSSSRSPWRVIAQQVGDRSLAACRKRWKKLHPFWSHAHGRVISSGALVDPKMHTEDFQLDKLLFEHPADNHYGLMALETFMDTETDARPQETVAGRRRPATAKPLAHFHIKGLHNKRRLSFAFPKPPSGRWNEHLLKEHRINQHQQRVTSFYLEMRSNEQKAAASAPIASW